MVYTLLLLALSAFTINVIPAFMLPTWAILVFAYIQYHLPFPLIILVGATFSTLGRVALYFLSKSYLRHFFKKQSQENMEFLGRHLNKHKHLVLWLALVFASPLPSNHIFIGSGLARVDIRLLASGFFIGRVVNYAFLVGCSGFIATHLQNFFNSRYTPGGALILELLGFGALYWVSKFGWQKALAKVL